MGRSRRWYRREYSRVEPTRREEALQGLLKTKIVSGYPTYNSQSLFTVIIIHLTVLTTIKISILLFYKRIFTTPGFRFAVNTTIWLLAGGLRFLL